MAGTVECAHEDGKIPVSNRNGGHSWKSRTWACGVFAAACLCLANGSISAQDGESAARPGREVSLPASQVKDTFFAYLLGIIRTGADIDVDNEEMRAILVEFKTTLDVPFDLISRFSQHEDPESADRAVSLEFQRDVMIPIPFSILFYHPGRITSTQLLRFTVHRSPWADPGSLSETGSPTEPGFPAAVGSSTEPASPAEPGEAFDLVLARGSILVEIDAWLKALFSAHLEDTWVRHIVFFKWNGDWITMLQGIGRSTQKVKRAYFDLTKNTILFPPSDSLKSAGNGLVPDSSP
jgi:hypothetical protein